MNIVSHLIDLLPKHILKLSCALILTNAYIRWFHLKNDQFQSILNHDHRIFYALEYGFYGNLIESLLGKRRLLIGKDLRWVCVFRIYFPIWTDRCCRSVLFSVDVDERQVVASRRQVHSHPLV